MKQVQEMKAAEAKLRHLQVGGENGNNGTEQWIGGVKSAGCLSLSRNRYVPGWGVSCRVVDSFRLAQLCGMLGV